MAIKNKLIVTALLMSFLIMGMVQTAHAYTFYIDEFSIIKNGNLMFTDSFNDGFPPPSSPDLPTPRGYGMVGTMGPETGGKLTLDSSGGVPTNIPTGDWFFLQRARLQTNIDPNDTVNGLKSNHTFSVTGVFDLIPPSVPLEGYGVRFNDGNPAYNGNDIAFMRVSRTASSELMIQLQHLDMDGHSITTIEETPLDTNHDQIALMLTKADAGSMAITASYAYIDGGIWGTTNTFTNTMDIFYGENFTRAEFSASTPVPEPATMLLLGSGLIALAGYGRKKFFKK